MEFIRTKEPDGVRVVLFGPTDATGSQRLFHYLGSLIEEGVRVIRLDCRELEALDVNGLSIVVIIHNRLLNLGGQLELLEVGERLETILGGACLDKLLTIHPCAKQAA